MHAMWRGSVSFGLVNIPVRLYKATETGGIHFRQLHRTCRTPISYRKFCPRCQAEVSQDEIVRGFEYAKGEFVVVEDDDLAAFQGRRGETIDLVQFADAGEIDPVMFQGAYYLAPEASGKKAYRLLWQALRASGRVGVARMTLRSAESLVLVRASEADGNVLVVHTLAWPEDVRSTGELPYVREAVEIDANELEVAETLIRQLTKPFVPNEYRDESRARLEAWIAERRGEAGTERPGAPSSGEVVDLMEALKKSLQLAKQAEKPQESKRKKRKTS
ncbi:non-homologous end joining protein Ku [Alicyclobacillus acidocaldarius]|uniref:Non-homologous end joining protein Ku n=1 Tax=Alicyclobacillus acidocaldarius (strain Tc-4-1) TaxID=1048834 RepID=F8IJW6_ALIAT|nr:Ku protein [Alicyclobacillus acidocaldarius]AEJ43478.1 Ku protein [Alicyclobacillus acidocaldarius subsp. acidocaldarius Tc-4-1]